MKQINTILVILAMVLMFVGCAENRHIRGQRKAQERITEIQKEYPELFNADTTYIVTEQIVSVPIENYIFDTVVEYRKDSVVVENERFRTVIKPYIIERDKEVVKWKIKTEIKADTVNVSIPDTVFQIQKQIQTKTITKKVKFIPFWVWVVIGLLILWIFHGSILELWHKYK